MTTPPPVPRRSIVRRIASRVRRMARRAVDRVMHDSRRSRSIRSIQELGAPRVILFICYGNICRSSYAAHSANRRLTERLRERIQIQSAGYYGTDRPAPDNAVAAAASLGVDLRPHRSQLLTGELVAAADLVIGMEQAHGDQLVEKFGKAAPRFILMGTLDSVTASSEIADPYGHSVAVFEQTYSRIDRCLVTLVNALESNPAFR